MIRIPTVLLLLATVVVSAPSFAHPSETTHRTITTTGYGEVKVKPDQVVVHMQVQTRHRSAESAKEFADEQVNRFLAAIKPLNLAREDIVASSLVISPDYDYRDRQRIFSGYSASRGLTVTLHQLEDLNRLLDIAVAAGINQIMQIVPESSQAEQHRLQAHHQAIEDSRRKAAALAAAYAAELGPIFSIDYRNQQVHYPTVEGAQMRLSADSGGGQYLHDDVVFTDSIQVVFDLIIPR